MAALSGAQSMSQRYIIRVSTALGSHYLGSGAWVATPTHATLYGDSDAAIHIAVRETAAGRAADVVPLPHVTDA